MSSKLKYIAAAVIPLAFWLVCPQGWAKQTINFSLDWSIYGTHAPFFVAKEEGLYAKQGLDVNIQQGQGSATVLKLIAHGSEPIGYVDYGTMARGVVQGMPVEAVFGITQTSPMVIISKASDPIKTPMGLEGKVIAMAPAESTAQIFPALLHANHVDPKKVSVLNPAVGAKNALFLEGRADALPGYVNVQVGQLESKGAKLYYFKYADFGVNTLSNGIIVNTNWAKAHPKVLRKFLAATAKAWKIAEKNPKRAIDDLLKAHPELKNERTTLTSQLKLTFPLLETPHTKGKPLGWMSAKDWTETQDILAKYAGLSKKIDVHRYYTNKYIPR